MLGSTLHKAFSAQGANILQLLRRSPGEAGQLQWNPAAIPAIPGSEALEGLTAAIHLSGANVAAHRWTLAYKREMTESRVQSTRALAETFARLRNPPRTLVVASAVGIYGDRGDELIDEGSAPGSGFLADLCQQWEGAAKPAVEAGIRVIHVRFGVVIGSDPGGALAHMLPLFRLGLGGPLGSGQQFMSWISIVDAASAIIFLLESPSLSGAVNLTAPRPVTNAEFTRTLGAQLNRPTFFRAPAFALRLAIGQMANEALLSSARVYPAKLTSAGFNFAHPDLDQAFAAALAPRPALS